VTRAAVDRPESGIHSKLEAQARIFIEKALLDRAHPLPKALAARCRAMLDRRTNVLRLWKLGAPDIVPQGWQARDRDLFAHAAAVRRAMARP
jgi:hypothetical protein